MLCKQVAHDVSPVMQRVGHGPRIDFDEDVARGFGAASRGMPCRVSVLHGGAGALGDTPNN